MRSMILLLLAGCAAGSGDTDTDAHQDSDTAEIEGLRIDFRARSIALGDMDLDVLLFHDAQSNGDTSDDVFVARTAERFRDGALDFSFSGLARSYYHIYLLDDANNNGACDDREGDFGWAFYVATFDDSGAPTDALIDTDLSPRQDAGFVCRFFWALDGT